MIIDSIQNAKRYAPLHRQFEHVFDFLRHTDLNTLPDRRIELDGDNLYINIATNEGKHTAPLEAHRCYIDIQMPISTVETMGWRATSDCRLPLHNYNPENDIAFFADEYAATFQVMPGQFVIFFPEDAHAPAMAQNLLKKLVVKVRI